MLSAAGTAAPGRCFEAMDDRRFESMDDRPRGVADTLSLLDVASRDCERVTLGAIAEALGHRGHGPFLLVPALLDLSPLGAVPGVPTLLSVTIIVFAAQILLGRDHLSLPGFARRWRLPAAKIRSGVERLRPVARRLDRWFHQRLRGLTHGLAVRIAAALCILLALTVPPLELLPFSSTLQMSAIAAFGIALIVRDGVLMLAAGLLAGGAIAAVVALLL